MTRLSVNINKIATLRNARGGNNPDVIQVARDCERFGAQGITVHPRPDERHIRYSDVMELKDIITTEFNIEGYPDRRYMEMVLKARPAQATLVPDGPQVLTSNAGWDVIKHKRYLNEVISELKESGARISLFIDPDQDQVVAAREAGADGIELYTEPYASHYGINKQEAVRQYILCAKTAEKEGLFVNAGHDLSLENLHFISKSIPWLNEVSIGHALICDALYFGLENTIRLYLNQLRDT